MKNSFAVLLVALLVAGNASADNDSYLTLDADGDVSNANSMTWPMLPGESLNELAAKFYPNNKVMQRLFVAKTTELNISSLPSLHADTAFKTPTAVLIPSLKSLSTHANKAKPVKRKAAAQNLQLSYNIKAAIEDLPKNLLNQYEYLVGRNSFLKEELAKLNVKLQFLQTKLDDLKLIFDKTLTLPQKKIFKNLSEQPLEQAVEKPPVNNTPVKSTAQIAAASAPESAKPESLLTHIHDFLVDPASKIIWLSVLILGLIGFISTYLLKKYREKMFNKLSFDAATDAPTLTFNSAWNDSELEIKEPTTPTPLGADTMVGEQSTSAILDEAKTMVAKGNPTEAIEHLKWAIRAKPRKAINLWLYMLQIFREQNLKDDFENYAKALHQSFNVMTPLWEEKDNISIVVAQSLEEFPHIIEKLVATWPNPSAGAYLRNLITDNRDGERAGFGKAVLDEILLLIMIQESYSNHL